MAEQLEQVVEKAVDPSGRRRLSRVDWIEEATEVLATHGLAALAVEPIAERLGVTKGSFYSHFTTRDELVEAVLERWRLLDTEQVIASLDKATAPRESLARFLEFGFERQLWGRVFAALCASAADPTVEPVMTQVRKTRLAYLEQALRDLGFTRRHAQDRAALIYSSYVGFWRLIAADPDWEYNDARHLRRIAEHIKATLIPGGESDGSSSDPSGGGHPSSFGDA